MEKVCGNCDLGEAIKHLDDLLQQNEFPCNECRAEHEKLRGLLEELKDKRQRYQQLEQVARDMLYALIMAQRTKALSVETVDYHRDKLEALGVSLDD